MNPAKKLPIAWIGLCLVLLATTLGSALAWQNATQENAALRTELALSQIALKDSQQRLEAERLLSRRQLEMLRQQPAFKEAAGAESR